METPGTEGGTMCAAPPGFSLTCGGANPPGAQQTAQAAPAAAPQTPTERLIALWALPDKTQFWAYIHANRTALTADRTANAWLDANMSVIGNWRADTVIARGGRARWTQAQITSLATQVRAQFPTVERVRAFVDNQYVNNQYKLEVLGQIMAQVGQAEYLLGIMVHGQTGTWESTGNNSGPAVDMYHNRTGFTWDRDAWCTMFAGYLHLIVGFRERLVRPQGVMWSNVRLHSWHENNREYTGRHADIESPSDYANYSGTSINRTAWTALKNSLIGHYNMTHASPQAQAASLSTIMSGFYSSNATPQAGDTVILNNATTGNNMDHTIVVERFDAATHTIFTVEGNSSNRVRGRRINLSANPQTATSTSVAHMSLLVRPGVEFYRENPNAAGEGAAQIPANATPAQLEAGQQLGRDLIQPLTRLVTELREMSQAEGTAAAGTTVAEMSNPTNEAGTTR
jgi:hypothetical protein